ncbi:MAG: hypothetical protein IPP32_12635 [Bacteroidetes bacterium]|nr:hypothetical protein [Bacteroidota bacterium]
MKKALLILISVLCSTQVFAQYEQMRNLTSIVAIENSSSIPFYTSKTFWEKYIVKTGFKSEFTCFYYLKDKDGLIYQIPVKETIIYKTDSRPKISIVLNPTTAKSKIQKKDKVFESDYTLINPRYDIDSLNFEKTDPEKIIAPIAKEHHLRDGEYSHLDIRNQYINMMYEYKNAKSIYFFGNYSPNTSYRRLVAIKPTTEYYDFVEKAQQKDKSVTHASDEWNAGIGYGFGTGNSFTVAYSQFYNHFKTDGEIIYGGTLNRGMFLSYRYQRIHMSRCAQPVIEASYGIIEKSRNDVYKLGLGLSFMLWSKNLYMNTVPYFRSNFRANADYTGEDEIGARPYSFGCDVGLVYKWWVHY